MTIFIISAKKVVEVMIEATRIASTEADRSNSNWAFSFIGLGRDLTLSKAKRDQIVSLLPKITELADSLDDKLALERLQGLIRQCKHDMEEKTIQHKIGTGNTEEALEGICSLLQSIYDKLSNLNLLNIPYPTSNKDPLDAFKKHIAFFYAEKLTHEQNLNLTDKLKRVPIRGDKIELTEQQNALVTQSLSSLSTQLSVLENRLGSIRHSERQTAENQTLKHYIVALALLHLKQQNNELCARYKPKSGLPILDPNDGILTDRLEKALEEIGYPVELMLPIRRAAIGEPSDALASSDESDLAIIAPEQSSTLRVLTSLQDARTPITTTDPLSAAAERSSAPAPLANSQRKKMTPAKSSNAPTPPEGKLTASP